MAAQASRRKALLKDDNASMNHIKLEVLNSMLDDILLDIAYTCKIDMGGLRANID